MQKNIQLHITFDKDLESPLEIQSYVLDENDTSLPSKSDMKEVLIKSLASIIAKEHSDYVVHYNENRVAAIQLLDRELKGYALEQDEPMTNIFTHG